MRNRVVALMLTVLLPLITFGQRPAVEPDPGAERIPISEMRGLIERFSADRAILRRASPSAAFSETARTRMKEFYSNWLDRIGKMDFDSMSQDGRIDYVLLKNQINYDVRELEVQAKNQAEIAPLLPFRQTIVELDQARR